MKRGYFYIVTGDRYRAELVLSLKELHKHTNLPVCVASDQNPGFNCDHFLPISNPQFSFGDKVFSFSRTPFEHTIYLDPDISFFHSPDAIFEGLDGADLLVSHEASLGLGLISRKAGITEVFPEVSTGLVAYNKCKSVDMLLQNWADEYKRLYAKHYIKEDQPAFRRALFNTNVKFSILPPEFHYIPANFMRVVGSKVYCVHNHDFAFAKKVGEALNARALGDYSGYVDGFGVFRNPYAMLPREVLKFALQACRLLPFLALRAAYISLKSKLKINS